MFSSSTSTATSSSNPPFNPLPYPSFNETSFWTLPPPQTGLIEDSYEFIDPWDEIYNEMNETHYSNPNNDYYYENISNSVEERNFHNLKEDLNYVSSQQMCNKLDSVTEYPVRQEYLSSENDNSCSLSFDKSKSERTYESQDHSEIPTFTENRYENVSNCDYQLQRRTEESQQTRLTRHNESDNQHYNHHYIPQKTPHVPNYHQNSSPITYPLPDQKHFPPDNDSLKTQGEDRAASCSKEEDEVRKNDRYLIYRKFYWKITILYCIASQVK